MYLRIISLANCKRIMRNFIFFVNLLSSKSALEKSYTSFGFLLQDTRFRDGQNKKCRVQNVTTIKNFLVKRRAINLQF